LYVIESTTGECAVLRPLARSSYLQLRTTKPKKQKNSVVEGRGVGRGEKKNEKR
jgi:hypothetical protein